MLKPIPARILRHTAVLHVCESADVWGNATTQDVELTNVCIQPTHDTRMTATNTEVVLTSLMFVDARLSTPVGIDIAALQDTSESNGALLKLTFNDRNYTVASVDTLYDDTGEYHHAEVGLV